MAVAAGWLKLTRPGPVFHSRRYVRTPAPPSEADWTMGTVTTLAPPRPQEEEVGWVIPSTARGLVMEFLPALAAVARGRLRLVGLPPRAPVVLRHLRAEHCPVVLTAPAGLVTEAALHFFSTQSLDDVLLADAFQAHTPSLWADARRLMRYFSRAVTTWTEPVIPPLTFEHDTRLDIAATVPSAPLVTETSQP